MIADFDNRNNGGGSKPPVVEALSVTANGSYTPKSGVDGFTPVTVNVPQSGGGGFNLKYINDVEISNKDIETFDKTGLDLYDVDCSLMFNKCAKIQKVDLGDTNALINRAYAMFQSCSSLTEVNLTNWDFSRCEYKSGTNGDLLYMFYGCANIENIIWDGVKFPTSAPNAFANSKLDTCTKLTVDSLMNLIDNLPTVSSAHSFKIGDVNLKKLSAEQIAVASGKNWTLY